MNHDCHGDIFTRFGKRYGRCFGDSTIFEIQEGMEFCPACKRPWLGTESSKKDWDPDESDEVLRQIDLPHYKFLAEEREKKLKYVEAERDRWIAIYKKEAGITSW
jgi:hypothetical protein